MLQILLEFPRLVTIRIETEKVDHSAGDMLFCILDFPVFKFHNQTGKLCLLFSNLKSDQTLKIISR